MNTVFLSLGANLGKREATLMQAVHLLEQRIGKLLRCSSFYYSTSWGFQSENEFCNICAAFHTSLSPEELLKETQMIECALGRTQKTAHNTSHIIYHDRPIDIDLLQYFEADGTEVHIANEKLTLPHPLMLVRDFVMVPLQEIMVHL